MLYILKNILISLSGLSVAFLSYFLHTESQEDIDIKERPTFENFSENHDFIENNTLENNIDNNEKKEEEKETF